MKIAILALLGCVNTMKLRMGVVDDDKNDAENIQESADAAGFDDGPLHTNVYMV